MPVAYLTIGLPGCGKSTWAREHVALNPNTVIVNNDTIRNQIYDSLGHRNWSNKIERSVGEKRRSEIEQVFADGKDVIVDNTHMNTDTLNKTARFCELVGFTVEFKDFTNVPIDVCIERDSDREGSARVGEEVIRRMAKQRQSTKVFPLPRWVPDTDKPTAIVVDIDGTLAENPGRNIFDESRVYEDLPRMHVVNTVLALQKSMGVQVIVLSGRSDNSRSETLRWLHEKCQFAPESFELYMRPSGDRRRDSKVKRELYEQYVAPRFSVMTVFDDRAQVVRELWSTLELPVFRCGPIDADEF